MADKVMQVTLTQTSETQDKVTRDMPTSDNPEAISQFTPNIKGLNLGSIAKTASITAIATTALDTAKKAYNKVVELEKQDRVIDDTLRNYGGSGFSSNTIGDRFDIFGKRKEGKSVVYKV